MLSAVLHFSNAGCKNKGHTTNIWKRTRVANLIKHGVTGVYYARFRAHGKSVWRSLKTTDVNAAQAMLPEVIRTLRETQAKTCSSMATTGDAIRALRAHKFSLQSREVKPRTLEYYEERTAMLLKSWPALETLPLQLLSGEACVQWTNRFEGGASSFNGCLLVLRLAMKFAIRSGSLRTDPTTRIQRRKIKNGLPDFPSREQFTDMLRVLDCSVHSTARHVANLVRLMAFSGCRLREATGLQWGDVDFDGGMMWIERQRDDNGRLTTPKNGKKRPVGLNPALRDLLLRMKSTSPRTDKTNRITAVDSCQSSLDHAAKAAKCPRITHHGLRHLFITACVESGVDFRTIAEWVGHQDGGMLIGKTYSHLCRDHSRRMAEQVDFASMMPANVAPIATAG